MNFEKVITNKEQYLQLFLLSHQQLIEIKEYLNVSDLFLVKDPAVIGICIVSQQNLSCEIKNLLFFMDYQITKKITETIYFVITYYKKRYPYLYVTESKIENITIYENIGFKKFVLTNNNTQVLKYCLQLDFKIIETERLYIREFTNQDYDSLCLMLKDPEVMYAYGHTFSDIECRQWLEKQYFRYQKYGFGLWVVILKETNTMIGQCGLTMQQIPDKEVLEIGYLFIKKYWHHGYALEAAKACKDYAFNKLHAKEVFSIIRDTNLPSISVATKNGMTKKGEFIKYYNNTYMPHFIYSKIF